MDISQKQNIDLTEKHVAVIGGAKSGVAAAILLKEIGAYPFVSDLNELPNLTYLNQLGISSEAGGHSEKIYDCDLIVVSPGVSQDSKVITLAQEKEIPVVSEIELASWYTSIPIAAITGSNGKTTTTRMLAEMCRESGLKTFESGNIGKPFSTVVLENLKNDSKNSIHILEVSSFQMEQIHHFKPSVAVILNLSPDHLDRYGSMHAYITAKLHILDNMTTNDYVVYNLNDELLCNSIKTKATLIPFSLKNEENLYFNLNETKIYGRFEEAFLNLKEIKLPGRHNISNFFAAATAAQVLNISKDSIRNIFKTFNGVPHRLENVRTEQGITFYNDSKATNIESVKVALKSFTAPVVLIIGGRDKGAKFEELSPYLSDGVKLVITIGESANRIEKILSNHLPFIRAQSMASAVALAYQNSTEGDVVLLSPGCTSFDMFDNFETRGEAFRNEVMRL